MGEPRKKPTQWEHIEQVNLFKRLFELEPYFPKLKNVFAIPNGGVRGGNELQRMINGKKLKQEGVRNGVPDIFVAIPRTNAVVVDDVVEYVNHAGMFIELKYGKNTPSDEQLDWINRLNNAGYHAIVCYGADEAFNKIMDYLNIKL